MNIVYISIYLFSVSFISILQFSVTRCFISLIKFIPTYFIVFDTIVNGIVYFLFRYLVLIYRNTTNFHVLLLYPGVLLNSFISFNSCLVESSGFLYIQLCHLQR